MSETVFRGCELAAVVLATSVTLAFVGAFTVLSILEALEVRP